MIKIIRTDSDNKDFIELVKQLDADLAIRDGADHAFYAQFNKTNTIKNVLVAYNGDIAVGCGAIREYESKVMEVKRMYVIPEARGKGIASNILKELEKWVAELFSEKCILETGKNQPEAIALYKKNGYMIIPNYGQYARMDYSVCFEKKIL
ncbi:MAG: GNAT family N-acetyltransferase [Chitinophagaceae bacterium]|nr:GNAT family N-acetyltransferase [Chitinophagaceae bacterium]